jgi:NADH dehydrogenase FAD-containing subunit
LGTADFLLDRGKKVEVISYLYHIGMSIPAQSLPTLYQRLQKKGVILTPGTRIIEILEKAVVVENVFSGETRTIEGTDTVVFATDQKANDELLKELEGKVKELYSIGDCQAPRKIHDAIREGYRVGRSI